MALTLLIELDTDEIKKAVQNMHLFVERDLGTLLGYKVRRFDIFPGAVWEVCDAGYGPHPIPRYDGKYVVEAKRVDDHSEEKPGAGVFYPGHGGEFELVLEDGNKVTTPWDTDRLDDPDEVLFYWNERYDELE